MNITVVGTGYVGLVTGVCFSEMGNKVICVDNDKAKIEMLNSGRSPIYEPGLSEMIIDNVRAGRLSFSTDSAESIKSAQVVFIAVGTPPGEDGSADLQYVLAVATDIAASIEGYTVIVNKSTVPVGTGELVKQTILDYLAARKIDIPFDVVSNPEFLKEGAAIDDFMRPDRIVLGVESERAGKIMQELYKPFNRNSSRVLTMSIRSAELTKYASNAMLATRISFMNELSRLCDLTGADINEVRHGVGSDARIGSKFLYAGVGYGGSCFPKDVKALIKMNVEYGLEPSILVAVEKVNEEQKRVIVKKIKDHFGDDLTGKVFAVWGLAFKPQTDDMREAPAVQIITSLIQSGAQVKAYDPVAMPEARRVFGEINNLCFTGTEYDALKDADALILVTEWHQFQNPDFHRIRESLGHSVIFDGRNQYDPEEMRLLGFTYYCIGRN